MSDPKRLLESGGNASAFERELLAREVAAAPSEKLQGAVWQRVLGALPPIGHGTPDSGTNGASGDGGSSAAGASGAGGANAGGSSAGAASATSGGAGTASAVGGSAGAVLGGAAKASGIAVAKSLALGVFAGTLAVTGAAAINDQLAPAAVPSSKSNAESSDEVAVVPPAPRLRYASTADPRAPAPPPPSLRAFAPTQEHPPLPLATGSARFELLPAEDPASRMRAERLALEQARRALRGGDPSTALGFVNGASASRGVLAQEREVLAIEALSAAGRVAEAKSRAQAFLSRFPGSPHQNHVGQFAR
jgi:hypothetical protein